MESTTKFYLELDLDICKGFLETNLLALYVSCICLQTHMSSHINVLIHKYVYRYTHTYIYISLLYFEILKKGKYKHNFELTNLCN